MKKLITTLAVSITCFFCQYANGQNADEKKPFPYSNELSIQTGLLQDLALSGQNIVLSNTTKRRPLASNAQEMKTFQKKKVYAEFGLGFGQTLFFGDMKTKLSQSYGGSFSPNVGNNLMMGFYLAPDKWKGLGIGSRIKGTFGTSVKGDDGNSYIFNYYNLAVSAKYYALSREFNKGLYVRGSFGFGQFTSKRVNETINLYKHQYAIGTSMMGGLGFTLPLKKMALSFEAEFDYSNRNGTIDGKGSASYKSGQLGGNIILSF